MYSSYLLCIIIQASDFLVSSRSNSTVQERELVENVYSNGDYADTASLIEQVTDFQCCHILTYWKTHVDDDAD